MDQIGISGSGQSSMILSQIKEVKYWSLNNVKTSWSQKGMCNTPPKIQIKFILNTERCLCSQNAAS